MFQERLSKPVDELKVVAKSSFVYFKHSACLLKGGKVYAVGKNRYFDRVYQIHKNIKFTVHAEIDAIMSYPKHELKGMDILIIRVKKDGSLGDSRPCNSCIDKMRKAGIRRAYYSTRDGDLSCELVSEMELSYETSAMRMWATVRGHITPPTVV
jgi:deoxycytidylate deaminase